MQAAVATVPAVLQSAAMPKKRFIFVFGPGQEGFVEREAARLGVSFQEYVRRLIDQQRGLITLPPPLPDATADAKKKPSKS